MLTISPAAPGQIHIIREIAHATWPATFGHISHRGADRPHAEHDVQRSGPAGSGKEQRPTFSCWRRRDGVFGGYASYELNYQGKPVSKLHKIYVLPQMQGKNVGRALLDEVAAIARNAKG